MTKARALTRITPKRQLQMEEDLRTQSDTILRQMEIMEQMSQHNQEMFEVVKNLATALAQKGAQHD